VSLLFAAVAGREIPAGDLADGVHEGESQLLTQDLRFSSSKTGPSATNC